MSTNKQGLVVVVDGREYQMNTASYNLRLEWSRVGNWTLWNMQGNSSNPTYMRVGGDGFSKQFEIYIDGKLVHKYESE